MTSSKTHRLGLVLAVPGLAVALGLGAAIAFVDGPESSHSDTGRSARVPSGSNDLVAVRSAATLTALISGLQAHLEHQPKDAAGWSQLGIAYVEQARLTGDPTYYGKAEHVLATARTTQPEDNDAAAAGFAALAAARHEFDVALRSADEALEINPYNGQALAIRTDALTELGRYDEAEAAARRADETKPGLSTFTRLAYQAELRGKTDEAKRLLEQALAATATPADTAYVQVHLGDLARSTGAYDVAARQYDAAAAAAPADLTARAGQARTVAARGQTGGALKLYADVVARRPEPQYLIEYGDLLAVAGRQADADRQYALVDAWRRLAAANGIRTDLEMALFDADHGSPDRAVAQARAEWNRRHSIHVADALAWALHKAGRHQEAWEFAEQASRTGYRNAAFLFHRGLIEKELGKLREASASLRSALSLDPGFSPLQAREARRALAAMGADR